MSQASPEEIISRVFGFQAFRPGQAEIVERLICGTHALAVMPTGAGKSLCYQVPALLRDGLTIVISPLVSLIDDQVAALRANGVAVSGIHSGRSRDENIIDWRRVQSGEAKILYMSPERLMTDRMLAALRPLNPTLFVVDEAHCISKWGASFRPEYEALSALRERFPLATMAAFTATADAATRQDIANKLFDGNGDIVVSDFDRPNLQLGVTPRTNWKKQLTDFLDQHAGESGIVYCLSRRLTDEATAFLNENGYRALPYHAGLSPEARRENQEAFMAEDGAIMVATIAFGMGIDKPDIRFVFHINLPGSMEAYYQEIGRAGRDGKPAEVQMLFGLDDIRLRRQFIEEDGADGDRKRREHKRLDTLLAYCEATQCRRISLLSYFGQEAEPCGNCDICLIPPVMVDGRDLACNLLGTICDTGQSFGAAHIIDVLRGAETEKLLSRNHDALSTYGTGRSKTKPFWQSFIRQAVAGGYLMIDIERFGALRLTEKGWGVLKRGAPFEYREIAKLPPSTPSKKSRAAALSMDGVDTELLSQLKNLRRELASAKRVPAYIVFSDATLIDLCRMRPENLDQMQLVNGIGPKKLADYGTRFLDLINAYQRAA